MKKILWLCLFCAFIFADEDWKDFEQEYQKYAVNDPLSGYNKIMTSFNVALYDYALSPLLRGYNVLTPEFIREGARNFFEHLLGPLRFVGNVLQLKFNNAGEEVQRFLANTLIGFGGLMDPASKMGLKKHPADLGLVLAHWGVGEGFHIVLPLLGPSNLRDALTLPALWYASPVGYLRPDWVSAAAGVYSFSNELSFRLDAVDAIYHNTPNLYPFLRDAYEQSRKELSR